MKLMKKFSALSKSKGFTLIELLVVIGIIAILTAVVTFAVNPGRQFDLARDTQRRNDINQVLSAVYQYAADNDGDIPPDITATPTNIGTGVGLVNLSDDLVPDYLAAIPFDPSTGDATDTDYVIFTEGNRVTASASGEVDPNITLTR